MKRKPPYDRYRAEWAHRDFLLKQENKGNVRKLDKDPKLRAAVVDGIRKDSSPEQVAARLRLVAAEFGFVSTVSHETVYRFVYSDPEARALKLHSHLRTNRPKRRKRGSRKSREKIRIPDRVGIAERPAYVEKRKEFGHFETDSVIFPLGRCVLSVQYERMTGLARLTKLADKSAPETASALRSLANEFDSLGKPVLSVTFDNGTENVLHGELVRGFGIATYFADPYCSWQKGGVENLNSLVRQYLPRSVRLEDLTDDEIYAIQEKLNDRPRKRLGWLTPNEKFGLLTDPDFAITELFP